jgi:hypothetical protein
MSRPSMFGAALVASLIAGPLALSGSAVAAQTAATVVTHDRAGYAVTLDLATRVSARWMVPTATCGADDTYASFRIALRAGAHVLWVGTAVDCLGGTPTYYAWQGDEKRSGHIRGGPVTAGDLVSATLASKGRRTSMSFSDITQGWGGGEAGNGGSKIQYTVATAGVVASTGATGLLPLTDFGTATFSKVSVDRAPIDGQQLDRLVMKSRDGVLQATPGPLHQSSFDLAWKHA